MFVLLTDLNIYIYITASEIIGYEPLDLNCHSEYCTPCDAALPLTWLGQLEIAHINPSLTNTSVIKVTNTFRNRLRLHGLFKIVYWHVWSGNNGD